MKIDKKFEELEERFTESWRKLMKNKQNRQFVIDYLHDLISYLKPYVYDGSDGENEVEQKILDVYKVIDYIKEID